MPWMGRVYSETNIHSGVVEVKQVLKDKLNFKPRGATPRCGSRGNECEDSLLLAMNRLIVKDRSA